MQFNKNIAELADFTFGIRSIISIKFIILKYAIRVNYILYSICQYFIFIMPS